uniref:Uncharacterized protein n=1 Tax=Hucho hucho TaxID=62062 RepID=A0A4W5RYE0_9TELE
EVGKINIGKKQGKADVSFTLNEDLTSLSAFGEKAASVRAPRHHPMTTMHSVGGQTLAVFIESSAGIPLDSLSSFLLYFSTDRGVPW